MNLNFARELKCVACHVEQKKNPELVHENFANSKKCFVRDMLQTNKKVSNFVHEILQIQKKLHAS